MAGRAKAGSARKHPCEIDIEIDYAAPEAAQRAHEATSAENAGYVSARVDGSRLLAHAGADTVQSLSHTADDYLECLSVAERIISGKDDGRKAAGASPAAAKSKD